MSYCRQEGKDQIVFLSKEDYDKPPIGPVPDENEDDDEPGLIMENGDINWNCPCLGGMATGPCGNEFREAFSCFHYSQDEQKGSDCYEQFKGMQECMQKFPSLYDNESGADMDAIAEEEAKARSQTTVDDGEKSGDNSVNEADDKSDAETKS
ncbi:hypothetical protein CAPTEDRAFT_154809 [Capitella teleta]|uniref:CHCH domain-containing protein n=1 Tax=Capitella teleta TaxID=283909 RepID=R7U0L6_CAPTE|nr:hypothetical protein CAPTEDRAFT_154809 [Capitella teleta]|eukprot:ELT99549.1 hypothetical protein CAPTEDRAFT_154809 [Capitella teleta]